MYFAQDKEAGRLYGTIWAGDGSYIVGELREYLKGKTTATIHIHSGGGSVFDGNLIYNELRKFKGELIMVVDGIAASMASVLIMAGTRVKMAENAWIMIHAAYCRIEGNAEEVRKQLVVLEKMEEQFKKIYQKRTGKSDEELQDLLVGDNWFSADMALEEKLIDEIVDPIIDEEVINACKGLDIAATAANFPSDEELKSKFIVNAQNTNPKTIENMKISAEALMKLGLKEGASQEEIEARIKAQAAELEQMKEAQRKDKEKRIKAMLDNAIQAGKIQAADRAQFEELAESNEVLAQSTIDKLPGKESVTSQMNRSGKQDEVRSDWTYADWRKKDTAGLLKIKAEDPERYEEIRSKK